MSYTQIGACPVCGAPIYVPTVWQSITPPLPVYTCTCRLQKTVSDLSTSTAGTDSAAEEKAKEIEENKSSKKVTCGECVHWTILGNRVNYGECCYFPIPFWAIEASNAEIYSGDDMASFCNCFKKQKEIGKENVEEKNSEK